MGKTNISWATDVWNPISGCTKVSPGCKNCYAETLDKRFHREGPYVPWTVAAQRKAGVSAIHLHPERLDAPLHWKKPRRIFVNSMSDLFHEDVPDEFIDQVFATMALTPWHTYQILTKRPSRMCEYLTTPVRGAWAGRAFLERAPMPDALWRLQDAITERLIRTSANILNRASQWLHDHYGDVDSFTPPWPFSNVWLGVSVENQRYADERVPLLAQCPAAVRFVSYEPALGPVKLWPYLAKHICNWDDLVGTYDPSCQYCHGTGGLVDWCIVGGESGPGHRPMKVEWVQSIADQCAEAGVPLFVKQDSGPRPGQQGRLPDSLWEKKEMP